MSDNRTGESNPDGVAYCWHKDCQDPSRDNQARLNVEARPTVFTSREALEKHAIEVHGIELDFGVWE